MSTPRSNTSPDFELKKIRSIKKPINNKDDFMLQEQDIIPMVQNPQRQQQQQQLTTQRSIKKPITNVNDYDEISKQESPSSRVKSYITGTGIVLLVYLSKNNNFIDLVN